MKISTRCSAGLHKSYVVPVLKLCKVYVYCVQNVSETCIELTIKTVNTIGLVSVVEESYTPTPNVEVLETIADYRDLIAQCVDDLHHHSKPLVFKFVLKEATSKAQMYYKMLSNDTWKPENGPGLVLCKYSTVTIFGYSYNLACIFMHRTLQMLLISHTFNQRIQSLMLNDCSQTSRSIFPFCDLVPQLCGRISWKKSSRY